MIQETGKYYLYSHIRLDKNEPFYIGLGCKKDNKSFKTFESEYYRAYTKNGRNNTWNGITSRTQYDVNILMESDDKSFIEQKEIEFIALYGRLCLSTGTLANLHRGGNFKSGHKLSEEQRMNISVRQTGSKHRNAIKIYQTNTEKIFETISEASKFFNLDHSSISDMTKGLARNTLGIMLYDDYLNNNYRAFTFVDKTETPVIDVITKKVYKSIVEASKDTGVSVSKLRDYLKGVCTNPTSLIKVEDYEKGLTPSTLFSGRKKEREVYNIETKETYKNVNEANEKTGISIHELYHKLGGSSVNNTCLIYKEDFNNGILPATKRINNRKRVLIDVNTKDIFNSVKEASIHYNIPERKLARYVSPTSGRQNLSTLVYLSEYIKENPEFKR